MKKIAWNSHTLDLLKQYAKPVGIGAGVGAAGMGLSELMSDDEEERSGGDIMKSMLLGAGLGGAGGAGYQTVDNFQRPGAGSGKGQVERGLNEKIPNNSALHLLTNPVPNLMTSVGVGGAAQGIAGRLLAPPKIPDTTPTLNYGGFRSSDPYFNKHIMPALHNKSVADNTQTVITPANGGKPGSSKTTVDHAKARAATSSASEKFNSSFQTEADAISGLFPGGRLSNEGINRVVNSSNPGGVPKLKFSPNHKDRLAGEWDPNSGKLMDPQNEHLYRVKQNMGAMGDKMNALQKIWASVANPTAVLTGKGAKLVDDTTRGMRAQANKPGGWDWVNKLYSKVPQTNLEDKVFSGPKALDPRFIPQEAQKNQYILPSAGRVNTTGGSQGRLNRFGYNPKSELVNRVVNNNPRSNFVRGAAKYSAGPVAGYATHLGLDSWRQAAMEAAAKSQNGNPTAEEQMRRLSEDYGVRQNTVREARARGLIP